MRNGKRKKREVKVHRLRVYTLQRSWYIDMLFTFTIGNCYTAHTKFFLPFFVCTLSRPFYSVFIVHTEESLTTSYTRFMVLMAVPNNLLYFSSLSIPLLLIYINFYFFLLGADVLIRMPWQLSLVNKFYFRKDKRHLLLLCLYLKCYSFPFFAIF